MDADAPIGAKEDTTLMSRLQQPLLEPGLGSTRFLRKRRSNGAIMLSLLHIHIQNTFIRLLTCRSSQLVN